MKSVFAVNADLGVKNISNKSVAAQRQVFDGMPAPFMTNYYPEN